MGLPIGFSSLTIEVVVVVVEVEEVDEREGAGEVVGWGSNII